MKRNTDEPHIIDRLQESLEKEDLVLLIDMREDASLMNRFLRSRALQNTNKRVAIFSTVDFLIKWERHRYLTVTDKEMQILLSLFLSYEASDRLLLLSESGNYGSMSNYIRTGVLSEEEMFEALIM